MKFLIALFFVTHTICVEVIDCPDIFIQGRTFEIPLDSTWLGINSTMLYDYHYDTLYNCDINCKDCLMVIINPSNCN